MNTTHLFLMAAPLRFKFDNEVERHRSSGWAAFIAVPGVIDMIAPLSESSNSTENVGSVVTARLAIRATRDAIGSLVEIACSKGTRLIGFVKQEGDKSGRQIPLDRMWPDYTLDKQSIDINKLAEMKSVQRPRRNIAQFGSSFVDEFLNYNSGQSAYQDAFCIDATISVSLFVPGHANVHVDSHDEKNFIATVRGGRKRTTQEELIYEDVSQCLLPVSVLDQSFPSRCQPLSDITSTKHLLEEFGYRDGLVTKRKKRSIEL